MARSSRFGWMALGGVITAGVLAFVVTHETKTEAKPTAEVTLTSASAPPPPVVPSDPAHPWCGADYEALPSEVCWLDGRSGGERHTLVIWLHGIIGKTTNWSHDHEKMLSRLAKTSKIEILFPRAPLSEHDAAYEWPGTPESQAANEEALIAQWMNAKAILEKREGKRFDETFLFGFSSGAYFASSLALRGRADVDGYAVFAGGQAMPAATAPATHFAPVFVGICADDPTGTAAHGLAFASSLPATIPHTVNEAAIGHDLSEAQFASALAYLRKQHGG